MERQRPPERPRRLNLAVSPEGLGVLTSAIQARRQALTDAWSEKPLTIAELRELQTLKGLQKQINAQFPEQEAKGVVQTPMETPGERIREFDTSATIIDFRARNVRNRNNV